MSVGCPCSQCSNEVEHPNDAYAGTYQLGREAGLLAGFERFAAPILSQTWRIQYGMNGEEYQCCPYCGRSRMPHWDDCPLLAMLRACGISSW